ncbi:restriction endonuclease [Polyangium aurulentum]|uniref:restriction endonuclease n=1 Tax=Polyangium aurulentum TaxID=2567896 RepID=UPI0010AE48D2|nr:restriction endonuclease [Polyangium aurulentum]UQA57083.1 restriction endonuclease [Polyangium aurulentum]
MDATGFMHKYYEWDAFELFVKQLYEGDGDVVVDRDVTEVDRYGAKRQTDVKITRRTRFHTYVTLVECKRWKEPVGRDRIDVLASSIEALCANKGAIFTTTGFEEGAVAYAKAKGIDLFVVRDLTPAEWGAPGRHLHLFLHTWAGEFQRINIPNAQALPLIDGDISNLKLDMHLDKEMARNPDFDLFSIKTGTPGPNLVGILADAHGLILQSLSCAVGLIDKGKELVMNVLAACEIDLRGTDYRQLRLPEAAVRLEHIEFRFNAQLRQTEIRVDRGKDLDFAVMVENYITQQRLLAHRRQNDPGVNFQVANPQDAAIAEPFQNGSLARVVASPWVSLAPEPNAINAYGGQLIRVLVDVVNGQAQLALRAEALPRAMPGQPSPPPNS